MVVFLWWCFSGGAFVMVFVWWCLVFLCFCGGVFGFLWRCSCGGVLVVVF